VVAISVVLNDRMPNLTWDSITGVIQKLRLHSKRGVQYIFGMAGLAGTKHVKIGFQNSGWVWLWRYYPFWCVL